MSRPRGSSSTSASAGFRTGSRWIPEPSAFQYLQTSHGFTCRSRSAATDTAVPTADPGWHSCTVPDSGSSAGGAPRRRIDAAASRTPGENAERSFYCRSCQLTTRGRWIPAGWYVLERAVGGGGRHLRIRLYCSLDCLATAGDSLAEAERAAGARRGLPVGVERDRARLVDIAQTLLHQGATIRAAGDQLDVPTSTLRHWLREAGVRVGADGTLTAPADPALGVTGKGKVGDRPDAAAGQGTAATAGAVQPVPPPPAGHRSRRSTSSRRPGMWQAFPGRPGARGPAHQPLFTCTVTATGDGHRRLAHARGTGGSKAAAKASAAAALLAVLAEDDPAAARCRPAAGRRHPEGKYERVQGPAIMTAPLTGVVPVVPTIFRHDETVDLDGTARVVDYLINAGSIRGCACSTVPGELGAIVRRYFSGDSRGRRQRLGRPAR